MAATCDVLIVGGGVLGVSLAYHLAQRRPGRVVLLEKAFVGAGASGKSAAIVRARQSIPLTCALARRGLEFYERFGDQIGGPPVFTRTGLVLFTPESSRADLAAAAEADLGEGVRMLSAQDLTDLDPNVRLAEDEIAAFEPDAGYLDPVQTVTALAEAARRHGADIRQGVEVKGLVVEKGRCVGVETNEGVCSCATLVLATGPWAAQLLKPFKITLPLEARRTQTALFRRPPDSGRRSQVHADFVQGLYFRPSHGDLIQVGAIDPLLGSVADPDHFDEAAEADWLPGVRQRLSRRYPPLHRAFGRGGYGVVYGLSPDGHPIIDRLPGLDGAHCVAGFGGNGFLLAPVVGELMADWILDGKPGEWDLRPLRLSRFEENDLVKPSTAFAMLG
jgi:sarcosine oxidase subunit beta